MIIDIRTRRSGAVATVQVSQMSTDVFPKAVLATNVRDDFAVFPSKGEWLESSVSAKAIPRVDAHWCDSHRRRVRTGESWLNSFVSGFANPLKSGTPWILQQSFDECLSCVAIICWRWWPERFRAGAAKNFRTLLLISHAACGETERYRRG